MDAAEIESKLFDYPVGELVSIIRQANREYWDEAAATIPDTLYDRVVERLRQLDPGSPVLTDLGASVPPGHALGPAEVAKIPAEERFGSAVQHVRPMLSLDKGYGEDELNSWAAKFEGEVLVMPKMDGIACSIRYGWDGKLFLAATRGSGTEGEDITANLMQIDEIPHELPGVEDAVEIRGELYMKLSVFERFKEDYSNPRNLTAGAMKQKDRAKSKSYGISFYAYDLLGTEDEDERGKMEKLRAWGMPVVEHRIVERDQLQATFEHFAKERDGLDFEIDGVVYRASRVSEQKRLGMTGHHPRYAMAYKFQGDTGTTTLDDVLWSVSRSGTVTPVALLKPIELSGAMISRASLHNLSLFRKLGVTRGATVEVTRRGGVIPYVERVVADGPGSEKFEEPTHCPACGSPVEMRQKREGEFLQCMNPDGCVTAKLRELEHFAKVVDIQGFGPKIVTAVVDAGLMSSPADFYRLRAEDLVQLERLAEKSAQNLIDQVEAHTELGLAVFLEALGIEHLGRRNSQLIARNFLTIAAVREVTREQLMDIKGVKEAIADAIVDGLEARGELIDELLRHVKVVDDAGEPDPLATPAGPLAGKSFVFTGTLESVDRKSAQAKVKALGGETPSGVSKTLSVLVVGKGRGAKSSKQKKAEKLITEGAEIEVMPEDAFLALVEEHGG